MKEREESRVAMVCDMRNWVSNSGISGNKEGT